MNQPESKAPETLAERFWSLARAAEREDDSTDPVAVVEHALRVLDQLDSGQVGDNLTARTLSFLALLRQYEVKGDLLYASPEQARGEQMDERALVFSVGVLIFEKLTGRHPFGDVGNPDRLARIRRGEMASGVNYFPIVPPGLRQVLVKAMGPFPEERWSSLLEMRAQLERFIDQAKNPQDYSGPVRTSRPLPALPREDEPTQVMNRQRQGAEPAVDLARMARASVRQGAARLETQPAIPNQFPPSVLIDETSLRPKRRIGGIALGMVAGAVVASLAFWLAWPGRSSKPAPAPRASAPAIAQPAPATAQPTTAQPAASTAQPSVRPAPTSSALAFDIKLGAQNAAAAARRCIAADRRVQFGASLLYDARTGRSRKVYFAATPLLEPKERACLFRALVGLDAGAPPPHGIVVTYAFHVTPTGATATGHIAPE